MHRNTTTASARADEATNASRGRSVKAFAERTEPRSALEKTAFKAAASLVSEMSGGTANCPLNVAHDFQSEDDDYVDNLARKLIQAVADGPEMESHCNRLALFASLLGMEMGLDKAELRSLRRGAYLHDIGKIGIPSSILLKRGPLDEREWRVMQQHPLIGEQICRDLPSLKGILPIIRSHHERWNGTGYPDGLSGVKIPLLARITQIADIYDALTTERPYKAAFSSERALEIIKDEEIRGWRDPELVRIVENLFPIFTTLPPDGASSFSLQALSDVVKRRSWC